MTCILNLNVFSRFTKLLEIFFILRILNVAMVSLNKEILDLEIKMFRPSKFFACGGLISCDLIKKMPDPGMKRF